MTPTDPTISRCTMATCTGGVPSTVRLSGATTGNGLDEYLTVRVVRETTPTPSFRSCSGSTADSDDDRGLGAGVLCNGTPRDLPDDHATTLVEPRTAAPESWTTGEARAYRFDVSLQDNDAAQTENAQQTFTWEARNS